MSRQGPSLSQGYVHACKTILAYFHFACKGSIPFLLEDPKKDLKHVTPDGVEYLNSIQEDLTTQSKPPRSNNGSRRMLTCVKNRGSIEQVEKFINVPFINVLVQPNVRQRLAFRYSTRWGSFRFHRRRSSHVSSAIKCIREKFLP
jgi:hypothetical protein